MVKLWSKDSVKRGLGAIVPRSLLAIAKDSRDLASDRRAMYVKRRLLQTVGVGRSVSLPRSVSSVLFVCHGNIMRSAAAAGFLRDELRAAGIAQLRVGSAGTNAHAGRQADTRAQEAARQLGLSLSDHRAARLTAEMIEGYDVIFAMDDLNYVNILASFPSSRRKLLLFGGMSSTGSYRTHEIADPYMTSAEEIGATIATIKGYVALLAQALASASGNADASGDGRQRQLHSVDVPPG